MAVFIQKLFFFFQSSAGFYCHDELYMRGLFQCSLILQVSHDAYGGGGMFTVQNCLHPMENGPAGHFPNLHVQLLIFHGEYREGSTGTNCNVRARPMVSAVGL